MCNLLTVELMNEEVLSSFDIIEIRKNFCYKNVFYINSEIYSKYRLNCSNNSYVLCYVDDEPHCILKFNGTYYDPTLQIHDHIKNRKYVFHAEFSYLELFDFMKKNNGIGFYNSNKYYIPPRLTRSGEITCSECDIP